MKILSTYFIIISVLFLLSCQNEQSMMRGVKLDSSDNVYGIICIDETLDDSLVSFRIDLKTDVAELNLSEKIDLGVSIDFNNQDDTKFYSINLYKLKKAIPGDYKAELQVTKSLVPKGMRNLVIENFSNSTLMTIINPDSTIITPDESGGGKSIESAIFKMQWFPEFEDHDYTIIEYYQDSKKSWVNVYRR